MKILIFRSLVSSTWVSFYWLPKPFQRYKINFSFQISHLHFAYSATLLQAPSIIKEYFVLLYIIASVNVFRKQDYCIYLILSYHFLVSQHQIHPSVFSVLILVLGPYKLYFCFVNLPPISLIPNTFFFLFFLVKYLVWLLFFNWTLADTSLRLICLIVLFSVCNK